MSTVVLASGGVDSSTVAAGLVAHGLKPDLLFVDYGQPARSRERQAVTEIAETFDLPLTTIKVDGGIAAQAGEIPARNLMLVALAAAVGPNAASVHLGIHAGTGYRDCSAEFVALMQRVLDFHSDGRTQLVAPFLHWPKGDVLEHARTLGIPLEITYSCETGAEPCGQCRSCEDRQAFYAG